MGQKQKTEKKREKIEEEKKDRKLVITMASYALQRHLGWRTQSRLGQKTFAIYESHFFLQFSPLPSGYGTMVHTSLSQTVGMLQIFQPLSPSLINPTRSLQR